MLSTPEELGVAFYLLWVCMPSAWLTQTTQRLAYQRLGQHACCSYSRAPTPPPKWTVFTVIFVQVGIIPFRR